MLVATAGHIDHGKTSLIRALTGVETDRLPEERARGISIDLGFAYWKPDEGRTIGFVDVPGHERFVRNMLAGVSAIDFALVVIAADDGVMPQTIEHVEILDLLGVGRGAVAITKCDRSSRERIEEVRRQARTLLAPTSLVGAAIFEVSSLTGARIAELGGALRAANQAEAPRELAGRNFRLAIDRAFSVTGVGTIVTGAVFDGAVETGARLVLSPRGLEARVRGLQSGGAAVTRVQAGERCAVNLAGVELAQVRRGDWLLTPEMHAPTSRIEVALKVSKTRGDDLKHHTSMHLHLGAAAILARVFIPAGGAIAPGEEAVVQLALEQPTCAVTGDRFVLRDPSGQKMIGGGRVIDAFVTGDRRKRSARALVSSALQAQSAGEALTALLAIPGHEVDTPRFARWFNLEPTAALDLYRQSDAVLLGGNPAVALPAARIDAVRAQIVAQLTDFHRAHPDAEGMPARDLMAGLSTQLSAGAFVVLQRELAEQKVIVSSGSLVKLPGHAVSISPADNALWQKLLPWLDERGAQPFSVRDLAGELRTSEAAARALLFRRRATSEVWRITEERFLPRDEVAALAAKAARLASSVGEKGFTAAQYRDVIGTGRTLAIHILEFFDRIGVTHRNGDLRRMRPDYELVVGSPPQ